MKPTAIQIAGVLADKTTDAQLKTILAACIEAARIGEPFTRPTGWEYSIDDVITRIEGYIPVYEVIAGLRQLKYFGFIDLEEYDAIAIRPRLIEEIAFQTETLAA